MTRSLSARCREFAVFGPARRERKVRMLNFRTLLEDTVQAVSAQRLASAIPGSEPALECGGLVAAFGSNGREAVWVTLNAGKLTRAVIVSGRPPLPKTSRFWEKVESR